MNKKQSERNVDYETFSKSKSNFDLVRGLFRQGLNIPQVCEYIGISTPTYYKWLTTYPEFEEATLQGREAADYAVENALYRRAVGFSYTEKKIIERNGEIVQKEVYQKQALPDPTSCAIWLNNRQPDKWKKEPNNESQSQKAIEINVINAKDTGARIKSRKNIERRNDISAKKRKGAENE